jgi:cytoskeletal protein RodZ
MPIAPHDDRAPQGAPAPRRVGAASSGHPGTETTSPRRHRDLVAWIALGLVVATVLTVVARVSVAPPRQLAATKPAHQTASPPETPSTTILAAYKQARDHVRTQPEPTPSAPQPTNPAEVAAPVTTVTTSTTVPSPRPSVPSPRPSVPKSRAAGTATPTPLVGELLYPADIATSFPFTSSDGLAAVRATWLGGQSLEVTLGCGTAVTSGGGTHGISLVVAGRPGPCTVSIALSPGQHGAVDYTLAIRVPGSGSATSISR